ncbi:Replication termination factor 2 [Lecanicillium sp. MT-2017a]|nr:Replication termination factor 2 [Lecanicillium sp. MT-2017a]
MGNDGGSIPKRRELVKDAARAPTISELKATALESLQHAWTHCALSDAPLDMDAAVSDASGRLFNYETILQALMPSDETTEFSAASLGVRSLRDVVKIKFSKTGDKWICPISMKEMGPATKCVYLVPCGHAYAEIAIKEIQEDTCPECSEPFTETNVISILPTTKEETEKLQKRIESLKSDGLSHNLKKDKTDKKKKKRKAEHDSAENGQENHRRNGDEGNKRNKKDADSRIEGINNSMAATLTARVLAEQDEKNQQRRLAQASAGRTAAART